MTTETNDGTTSPPAWIVRAGKDGEDEDTALVSSLAIIGFNEVPDASSLSDEQTIADLVNQGYGGAKKGAIRNFVGQLTGFVERIREGDLIALPMKTQRGLVALGRVTGPYKFRSVNGAKRHTRSVRWDATRIQKNLLGDDLQRSLNVPGTISKIGAPDAERRLMAVLGGHPDPSFGDGGTGSADEEDPLATATIAQDPHEQIVDYVGPLFPDHRLAELVDAILQADGWTTRRSPPGPDGGVDIRAARGSLGLDPPRLCVQVKATKGASGVGVLRELQGTVRTFHADEGLLVSWGGFTRPLEAEAKQSHFSLRLWGADDVVHAIYRTYERLPTKIQAAIPLRQVWTLAADDEA